MSAEIQNARLAPNALARSSPRIRYRFRIAAEGFALLVIMILVGFAAWHSGTNLLYLIFAILIAFYLIHGGMLWINLFGLSTTDQFPESVIVNQPFDVPIEILNKKRHLASYALVVRHELKSANQEKSKPLGACYFSTIRKSQQSASKYTAVIPRRGLHQITKTTIITRYPFGFEERSQVRDLGKQILVLPETFGVAGLTANTPYGFGDRESQVKGAGTDIYGLRDYDTGEPARHIHWPTSARAQKLIVTEFARDERRQIVLILDNGSDAWETGTTQDFENAVTLTASVAKHLINTGFEVGLVTASDSFPVGQGPTQLRLLLRHLAVIQLVKTVNLTVDHTKAVKILYGNQTFPSAKPWQIIDSRTWTPPTNNPIHGEKLL